MSFDVIQMSEFNTWLQAARADGGFHKAKIKITPDPERYNMKKIEPKDLVINKKLGKDRKTVDVAAEINERLRNGEKPIDLNPLFKALPSTPKVDRYEGKRVVDNSDELTFITYLVGDAPKGSYEWASDLQRRDAAIHSFCYLDTDFLYEAAGRYATLADDEAFMHRAIDDTSFVYDTLNFFTGGNYAYSDAAKMEDEITTIVEELAQQIKNGEAPDLNKLQNKLTIGGVDVSLTELMEYQKTGRELMDSFQYGHLSAPLSGASVAEHAKMGLAKSIAELYGSDKGELGKRFSEGITRIYEKAVARQEKNASSDFWQDGYWSSEAVNIQVDSAKLFGHMKTDSKESMTRDLSEKLNQLQSRIRAYCYSFGNQLWYAPNGSAVNLNNTMNTIQDYFQSWMKKIG